MATRSKAWVCGPSLAGVAVSNPAGVMDIFILSLLYDVRKRSLRQADHSFGGFLPSVVCRSVIVKPRPWPTRRCRTIERIMRDKDPAVPDFVKRDAKYNSLDISDVNVIHFCMWQGLPDRLNKSDLGDIESEGCGPLFP